MSKSISNAVVERVYRVSLMPDVDTVYDPFLVTLTYTPERAARLRPESSAATSAAFRAAVAVERQARTTPPRRRFFCAGSEFVCERPPASNAPERAARPVLAPSFPTGAS